MEKFPRLSHELIFPRRSDTCQACGNNRVTVDIWREHDDADNPSNKFVALCRDCSESLIEPHPRLYSRTMANDPRPGAMLICAGCRYAVGLDCRHADLKSNGGKGLMLTLSTPSRAHISYSGKNGRRCGNVMSIYPTPPSKCAGHTGIV